MDIPPKGWGAIETLVYDYAVQLAANGHEIKIINTKHLREVLIILDEFEPEIIHIHYDEYIDWVKYLRQASVYITSHFGYLSLYKDNFKIFNNHILASFLHLIVRSLPGRILRSIGFTNSFISLCRYYPIFNKFLRLDNNQATILCLSPEIASTYRMYNPKLECKIFTNGARQDLVRYTQNPLFPDRALYLGKIEPRKKQSIYQSIPFLYFVGPSIDRGFDTSSPNYLGIWKREEVYNNLTDYSTLVLLSECEAHALVCCEALIAGLGLVVSENAAANLDINMPFITVIDQASLSSIEKIYCLIQQNIEISSKCRSLIRDYGLHYFSINKLIAFSYPPLQNYQ